MKDARTSLCAYLPLELARTLEGVPCARWSEVQEVRIRRNAPLTLSSSAGNVTLGEEVTAAQVQECFLRLCERAVHTHQEELRQGFVTTRDGFRVGVAGTAVLHDGVVTSYRDITSLCVRIPRVVKGCALPLLPYVCDDSGVGGLLLCGAPASGKTTLLRDLAQSLSERYRVAVIDERRELTLGGLPTCDVLAGCPKALGIVQAVRTLAPDAVIVDEIGGKEEWEAVAHSVFCGVPVIASVHACRGGELTARKEVVQVLKNGGFPHVAFLPPRGKREKPITIRKAAELFEDTGCDLDRACLCGRGHERCASAYGE